MIDGVLDTKRLLNEFMTPNPFPNLFPMFGYNDPTNWLADGANGAVSSGVTQGLTSGQLRLQCDNDQTWKDSKDRTCQQYADLGLCDRKGGLGASWDAVNDYQPALETDAGAFERNLKTTDDQGNEVDLTDDQGNVLKEWVKPYAGFDDFADAEGKTANVCHQCGCGGWFDLYNIMDYSGSGPDNRSADIDQMTEWFFRDGDDARAIAAGEPCVDLSAKLSTAKLFDQVFNSINFVRYHNFGFRQFGHINFTSQW